MMYLTRTIKGASGIFGELKSEDGKFKCHTLEHAYPFQGDYLPKIRPGNYLCVKGEHKLLGMTRSFETFAICGVPGHSGILFHPGNSNLDSSGCVLVGESITHLELGPVITESRKTFEYFMEYSNSVANFMLTVQNQY